MEQEAKKALEQSLLNYFSDLHNSLKELSDAKKQAELMQYLNIKAIDRSFLDHDKLWNKVQILRITNTNISPYILYIEDGAEKCNALWKFNEYETKVLCTQISNTPENLAGKIIPCFEGSPFTTRYDDERLLREHLAKNLDKIDGKDTDYKPRAIIYSFSINTDHVVTVVVEWDEQKKCHFVSFFDPLRNSSLNPIIKDILEQRYDVETVSEISNHKIQNKNACVAYAACFQDLAIYYAAEGKFIHENMQNIVNLIPKDGDRVRVIYSAIAAAKDKHPSIEGFRLDFILPLDEMAPQYARDEEDYQLVQPTDQNFKRIGYSNLPLPITLAQQETVDAPEQQQETLDEPKQQQVDEPKQQQEFYRKLALGSGIAASVLAVAGSSIIVASLMSNLHNSALYSGVGILGAGALCCVILPAAKCQAKNIEVHIKQLDQEFSEQNSKLV